MGFNPVKGLARTTRLFEQVALVVNQDLLHLTCANVFEHPLHFSLLFDQRGAGGVDHMQQQIGLSSLVQRGFEGLDQFVRQVADEPHGVAERNRALRFAQPQGPRGGVQRRKQLVGRVGARFDHAIKKRRFASVGVAHQGHPKGAAPLACLALCATLAFDFLQTLFDRFDAVTDHAPVQFDLRFTRATTRADAALLALQVAPPPDQPGGLVLQPSQFDLQLAFMALSAVTKDVQDQPRPVRHGHAQVTLQVALLGGAERLIEYHAVGRRGGHQGLDFIGLAAAYKQGRVWCSAFGGHARHHQVAG